MKSTRSRRKKHMSTKQILTPESEMGRKSLKDHNNDISYLQSYNDSKDIQLNQQNSYEFTNIDNQNHHEQNGEKMKQDQGRRGVSRIRQREMEFKKNFNRDQLQSPMQNDEREQSSFDNQQQRSLAKSSPFGSHINSEQTLIKQNSQNKQQRQSPNNLSLQNVYLNQLKNQVLESSLIQSPRGRNSAARRQVSTRNKSLMSQIVTETQLKGGKNKQNQESRQSFPNLEIDSFHTNASQMNQGAAIQQRKNQKANENILYKIDESNEMGYQINTKNAGDLSNCQKNNNLPSYSDIVDEDEDLNEDSVPDHQQNSSEYKIYANVETGYQLNQQIEMQNMRNSFQESINPKGKEVVKKLYPYDYGYNSQNNMRNLRSSSSPAKGAGGSSNIFKLGGKIDSKVNQLAYQSRLKDDSQELEEEVEGMTSRSASTARRGAAQFRSENQSTNREKRSFSQQQSSHRSNLSSQIDLKPNIFKAAKQETQERKRDQKKHFSYVSDEEMQDLNENQPSIRKMNSSDLLQDLSDINEIELENPTERDVLSRQQINQSIMDIEDQHPLSMITHYDHIVPCCKVFQRIKCMRRKPNFKHSLRITFLEELDIKMPKSDRELCLDPFIQLGYGINAFFEMLTQLLKMFLVITVFCIPLYIIYTQNPTKGLKQHERYIVNQISLGNLGGASVKCQTYEIKSGEISFACENGQIQWDKAKFGVMATSIQEKYFCSEQAIWDVEHHKAQHKLGLLQNCTALMDYPNVNYILMKQCDQQKSCSTKLPNLYKANAPRNLIEPDGACGDEAFLYIQAPCTLPPEEQSERQIWGLLIGCITVLIYLFLIVYLDYIKSKQMVEYVDWDVKTITAGDYSVEFDIRKKTYDRWRARYFDERNPMSQNAQFKLYIQNELEERITKMPDMGYDEKDDDGEEIDQKIAQITFAYQNECVINWLSLRGIYLKLELWKQAQKVNEEIAATLKNNSQVLDNLQRPCTVFCTFETEEGYNRALVYSDKNNENRNPQCKLLGEDIQITEASEPTDIIWENRHFTEFQRNIKRAFVYIVILTILSFSAVLIYTFIQLSQKAAQKYPNINCEDMTEQYKLKDPALWEYDAVEEFMMNEHSSKKSGTTHFTGIMQCFCDHLKDTEQDYEKTFTVKHKKTGEEYSSAICKIMYADIFISFVYGQSIGFMIIGINYILKHAIWNLVKWVGEETYSQQLASIVNGVFMAQFFNTGFLLLFVNANMSEHAPHFLTKMLDGQFYDYMPEWYRVVGYKIVETMIIESIKPYGVVIAFCVAQNALRWADRKFTSNAYNTRCTSMAIYKIIHSGIEYDIHFKYSAVLNVACVTMMYGVGMPILFPVAAFNFLNQYICERIIVAYQVKKPPVLDDKLAKNAIQILYWSPVLLLFNGYWMLSNPQIFENTWSYIESQDKGMKSDHYLTNEINWASPVLLMCCTAMIFTGITKKFQHLLMDWGFAL